MSHQPRKRFGQNFLHDLSVIDRIVSEIHPSPEKNLVEIGPGQGALTVPLLKAAGRLQVVELDRDLIPPLKLQCQPLGELTVHQADALNFDFHHCIQPGKRISLIGNLPYNISTPLLFHLVEQLDCIDEMVFMLQKEVVDRMVAAPGSKTYGRLSVMIQYYCSVEALFEVPPESFFPAPKVDSAIVRLIPYPQPPYLAKDKSRLDLIVREAFSQRRKTLRNSLKKYLTEEDFARAGINPELRAENLSVEAYVQLANLSS